MIHRLFDTPFWLFLLIFSPSLLLLTLARLEAPGLLKRILVGCGVLCLGLLACINLLNIFRPGAFWQDEPNILAISAIFLHGGPMYHARSAPMLYSLLYGPSTYLVFTPFLDHFSHPFTAIHTVMTVIVLASLGVLYALLRERLSPSSTLALLTVAAALLLSDPMHMLGVRNDAWLLFCISAALFASLRRNWLLATLGTAVFAGLALDFKITVAPVLLLLLAILYRRHGTRALLVGCSAMAACALSLFLLPGISLSNYFTWLLLSGQQGLVGRLFTKNLLIAAFLLAAGVTLRLLGGPAKEGRHDLDLPMAALGVFALCTSILTGSKDGAGPWHLWPMLPFLLLWAGMEMAAREVGSKDEPGRRLSDLQRAGRPLQVLAAVAIAATAVCLRHSYRDFFLVHSTAVAEQRLVQAQADSELRGLVRRFTGRNLAMGYGTKASDDRRVDLRFELADWGEDYFLDENAEVEAIKSRMPFPDGLLQRVLSCKDIWLIPHGEAPFSTLRVGVLPSKTSRYIFPDSIRLHFAAAHTLVESGSSYDLWACPSAEMGTALVRPQTADPAGPLQGRH